MNTCTCNTYIYFSFDLFTGSTLFVGNLSFDCDEDSLYSFFDDGGFKPDAVRIISRDGRPKGSVIA